MTYFMRFQVLGEIAEMLLLDQPERRLLVDISTETRDADDMLGQPYVSRTCFSIRCPDLIRSFQEKVSIGDTIQATGTFSQTDYVPHKTTYIDTTFLMQDFTKIHTAPHDFAEALPAQDRRVAGFLH
ncbi:hypothetical protein [Shimia sp. SDUM112013]|uniref:hypothetical protein n=1 Tax=Shimia sp. SDUM112013 TaxID=3136160 RepID=UPI0032ECFD65